MTKTAVDLYILGAGISFPEHLTIQTLNIMSECSKICSNLPASHLDRLPDDIRDKAQSLWPLYQDGRLRTSNYRDVTEAVLKIAEENPRPVAWLTQGHPTVFDSVSAALGREARSRAWQATVVPCVSSIDTVLSDLGIDPAGGFLIHEATSVYQGKVRLDPSLGTMLLQPSAFMSDRAQLTMSSGGPDLSPLRDYLLQFFDRSRACVFVRSSTAESSPSELTWTTVGQLAEVPFKAFAGSSLIIPQQPPG
jgi:uncharacterized protein YabN with tetrapyrrole methylase and pyrophosphatase domain